MSEMWISRPKFGSWVSSSGAGAPSKNVNFSVSLIINYSVSCDLDKAYKVILGLFLESAWTITPFDSMEKTVLCRVKCLHELACKWMFRHGNLLAWNVNVNINSTSSIFQVQFIFYLFYSNIWKHDSRTLTQNIGERPYVYKVVFKFKCIDGCWLKLVSSSLNITSLVHVSAFTISNRSKVIRGS